MKRWKLTHVVMFQHITLCLLAGWVLSNWLRAIDALAGRTTYTQAIFLLTSLAGCMAGAFFSSLIRKRFAHAKAFVSAGLVAWAILLIGQILTLPTLAFQWNQALLLTPQRTFTLYLLLLGKLALLWGFSTGFVACWIIQASRVNEQRDTEQAAHPLHEKLRLLFAFLVGYFAFRILWPGLTVEHANSYAVIGIGLVFASMWSTTATTRLGYSLRISIPLVATILIAGFMRSVLVRPSVLGEGPFARMIYRDSGFARGTPQDLVISSRHVVASFTDKDYQTVTTLDGRPILFGNRFHASRMMTGYIPLLMRPNAKLTAIVGTEAALFLPSFVHGGQKQVTLAECDRTISSALIRIRCGADTNAVAGLTAATRFASLAANVYDIVLVAPEPLWMRNAARCYTTDALQRYKRCLVDDGIVALHLDTRAMTELQFAAVAQNVLKVFKEAQLWNAGIHDWILIGCDHPIKTPLDKAAERFDLDPVFIDRLQAGHAALPEAFACMITATDGLRAWVSKHAAAPALSALAWQMPQTLFSQTATVLRPGSIETHRQAKLDWILPGQMDLDLYIDLLKNIDTARDARAMSARAMDALTQGKSEQAIAIARTAAAITPRDILLVEVAERIELEARRRMSIGDFKGAAARYENLLVISPGHALFHYGMGFALRSSGNANGAFDHFSKAIALAPEQIPYRLALAQFADATKRFREADEQFKAILARDPNNVEALFLYAKSLGNEARKPHRNLQQAIKYAEYACKLTHWKNPEYVYGLADLYIEGGRVLEGMGLKRTLKKMPVHTMPTGAQKERQP